MSYYVDKKYTYLKQFGDAADKLRNEVKLVSSRSDGDLQASQRAMSQNINAAKESKEHRLDELSNTLNGALRRIDENYMKRAKEIDDEFDRKMAQAEKDYQTNLSNEITNMEQQLNRFNANAVASIVTMPPYLQAASKTYIAPLLKEAPTLTDLQHQAQQRTYLPQVLAGVQKVNNGTKTCVLPAYAQWQTMEDETTATTGNIMLMFDRQTCQKQALTTADAMIYRMLMAFPIGSLHVSIIDPTSIGVQTLTRRMEGSEELYNKRVYKEPGEIDKHLKMLEAKIAPVKEEFNHATELSLVQYNRNGIKHGYELVILYDPFSKRPGYGDCLRNIMANGISAGIYVMVIQSDLMKPEVLQEFDFSSFSTVIMADRKNFIMLKDEIEWNAKAQEFNSKQMDECDYLPTSLDANELIDPLDVTEEQGLVSKFFDALNEDWENVTTSLTTKLWSDWKGSYDEADVECWTHGIEVPIGINEDTKEEMFFRVENNASYIHSFVLGKTRSGKSKFLCTTISSIAMKYSPRAVQMYLFDFKDGLAFRCYLGEGTKEVRNGVEFKNYDKPTPHMRWLVTTKADNEMFLSVLHHLKKEKDDRKKIFDEYNERDLEPVNKKLLREGKQCLPRILLIVDECQDIYKSRDSKKQREINQLFEDFAKKYGAFGIHLILSSQEVPSDMTWITQISNNYILNAGDARYNQLLSANSDRSADDIQKRIGNMPDAIGLYSTIDDAYISMFGYEDYEEAGIHIRQRAEQLLGDEINRYVTRKWTGELDIPYCKTLVSASMEFGTNTLGDATIGTFIANSKEGNVMIYGAQGGERAQRLTMRTVLTSLRGQFMVRRVTNNVDQLSPIYIVNGWNQTEDTLQVRWGKKSGTALQDSNLILSNMAKHQYVNMVQPDGLGELLVQLKEQVDRKENKFVLLYLIGTNELDALKPGATVRVQRKNTADGDANANIPRWKQNAMNSGYGSYAARKEDDMYEEVETLDLLNIVLHEGPMYGIHTVMQVSVKGDLEERGISHRDFRYFIFQQAQNFSLWHSGPALELRNDMEKLPVDEATARTIFVDSNNAADSEQFVIPFMLYELVEEAQKGNDVGQYIMDNTKELIEE